MINDKKVTYVHKVSNCCATVGYCCTKMPVLSNSGGNGGLSTTVHSKLSRQDVMAPARP